MSELHAPTPDLGDHRLRLSLTAAGVDAKYHAGLVRYLNHHVRPGDFLRAVLANDLIRAALAYDGEGDLVTLARWIHNYADPQAYGSADAVDTWCTHTRTKDESTIP